MDHQSSLKALRHRRLVRVDQNRGSPVCPSQQVLRGCPRLPHHDTGDSPSKTRPGIARLFTATTLEGCPNLAWNDSSVPSMISIQERWASPRRQLKLVRFTQAL
uniref:Uncharacterized protein n=1 Tax=Panagrellus redivivus TaxID=6233 RepID=A0A7E4VJR0_PANRE